MVPLAHYTCHSELLPMVEATLSAHGYRVTMPRQQNARGATALVLRRDSVSALLMHSPQSALAEIELWGEPSPTAESLLDMLPLGLQKQPPLRGKGD